MSDKEPEGADLSVMEEAGVGFDPTTQYLDLTKDEKRRTTALMMAVNAYKELIIKEADYLLAAADLARRDEGPQLHPATIDAMVVAAVKFDHFIADGQLLEIGEAEEGEPGRDAITDTEEVKANE